MATLDVEVQNGRYSAEKLIQLTNPDNPNATTINMTNLLSSVNDVVASFDIWGGISFNPGDTRHVMVGCEAVIIVLQMRQLNADPAELRKQWRGVMQDFAESVGGRDKTVPQTDAVAVPTPESPDGSPVIPIFDPARFQPGGTPSSPGSGINPSLPSDLD